MAYRSLALLEPGLQFQWRLGEYADEVPQGVYCLWHNRLLTTVYGLRRLQRRGVVKHPVAAFVSASRDGDMLSEVLTRFGVRPIRGSSSRFGGRALVEARSLIRDGYIVALTPDGPRGPVYSVKAGPAVLARSCETPLIGVVPNANRKWRLRSWDRFEIPKFRARLEFQFGSTWRVMKDDDPDAVMKRLREEMLGMIDDKPEVAND